MRAYPQFFHRERRFKLDVYSKPLCFDLYLDIGTVYHRCLVKQGINVCVSPCLVGADTVVIDYDDSPYHITAQL